MSHCRDTAVRRVVRAYSDVGLRTRRVRAIRVGESYTPSDRTVRYPDGISYVMALYDLAHYIVVSPEARELSNFGLGTDAMEDCPPLFEQPSLPRARLRMSGNIRSGEPA